MPAPGATSAGLPPPGRVLVRPLGSRPGGSVCLLAAGCQLSNTTEPANQACQFVLNILGRMHQAWLIKTLGQAFGVLFVKPVPGKSEGVIWRAAVPLDINAEMEDLGQVVGPRKLSRPGKLLFISNIHRLKEEGR